MARLSDTQMSVMADFWNILAHEAALGTTVTDVQVIARAVAENAGRTLTFEENAAIATLYGYGRRMDNAATAFQAADPAAPITPDLMAVAPWARDQQVINTVPIWHGIFEFTYIDQAGVMQTEHRTSVWDLTFPATVDEAISHMQADAEAMARKYNVELVSIKPIQIVVV